MFFLTDGFIEHPEGNSPCNRSIFFFLRLLVVLIIKIHLSLSVSTDIRHEETERRSNDIRSISASLVHINSQMTFAQRCSIRIFHQIDRLMK